MTPTGSGFALTLSVALAGLAVLATPGIVQRFISLDWQMGNIRPWLHGLQAVLGGLALLCWAARHRLGAAWRRAFPTNRRLLFVLLAVLVPTAAALTLAELALRRLHFPLRIGVVASANAMARFDPDTGWSYIPDLSVVRPAGSERRPVAYHFDRFSSRVRAAGTQHDPARPSVLFVGCSFTLGEAVPYEETFTGQLEARPLFPLQVVNGGVGGFGSGQSFQMMKRLLQQFPARAVVYTFIPQHRDRDAVWDRRLFHPEERLLGTTPQFELRRDGTPYLRRPALRYEDLFQSQLWACFQIAWLRYGPLPEMALNRALVRAMKDYAESRGARFYVVDWAQGPSATRESPFTGLDVRLIDTRHQQPPGWNTWYVPGDPHPDGRAHAHVASLLAAQLSE